MSKTQDTTTNEREYVNLKDTAEQHNGNAEVLEVARREQQFRDVMDAETPATNLNFNE